LSQLKKSMLESNIS